MNKNMEQFRFTFEAMTTPCEVQIYDFDKTRVESCFKSIKDNTLSLEKKYNFFDKKSYLNRVINNRSRNKINIDLQTFDILKQVKQLSLQTDNIFDISIGTIKECYNKNSIEDIEFCLKNLKDKYGSNTWSLKDNRLSFQHKETKLDLGGVIKEYAVDFAGAIIKQYGIKSALINFGGDILAVGSKPDQTPFCIGIKNPKDKTQNLLFVNIINQALTTSANYERNRRVENIEFSHIIPTKYQNSDILSSTIIADTALKSGIFSTSFMINPSCNILDDMKVVLIDSELNLHQNLQ